MVMDAEALRHCVEMAAYHQAREELWLICAKQREDMIASCQAAVSNSSDRDKARDYNKIMLALKNSLGNCERMAAMHHRMTLHYRAAITHPESSLDNPVIERSGMRRTEPFPSPERSRPGAGH
jgi:hypothetical protein